MEKINLFTLRSPLFLVTVVSLLFPSAASSTEALLTLAVQTLTDAGFLSMALTLRLASPSIPLPSANNATVFVPPNAAFIRSGPLPLSLLKYHILPERLPLQNLSSLQPNTPLPTLLPNSYLSITSSSSNKLSLNDVVVSKTPIFDDGSLLLLAIDDFFNSSSLQELESEPARTNAETFAAVTEVLKSHGCSVMATFLDAQLSTEFGDERKFTIFAPLDEAFAVNGVRNIGDYSTIFRKHVVPKLITWRDLIRLPNESLLPTFSDGFEINVTVSPRMRFLNGVLVAVPDMFRSDLVVVHGIHGLLDSNRVEQCHSATC
ncbi:putative fasciclin-like arabinogalactan protein 20 [Arachis stenosperma]|uniref:putative fasciclin-like arabinogalactan protein 20 n=1 Tax=Arachis stenosperma TaxID=217475 RepID=UPI0025AC4314|nr:putative fasciclin-like arabinogalactan protein 20 [Arachis stenosperma]